jgi:hypothetical protein
MTSPPMKWSRSPARACLWRSRRPPRPSGDPAGAAFPVDAFTRRLFGGDAAAGVVLDELFWPDERLQQIAPAENNLAETAFLVEPRPGDARPRTRPLPRQNYPNALTATTEGAGARL